MYFYKNQYKTKHSHQIRSLHVLHWMLIGRKSGRCFPDAMHIYQMSTNQPRTRTKRKYQKLKGEGDPTPRSRQQFEQNDPIIIGGAKVSIGEILRPSMSRMEKDHGYALITGKKDKLVS